MLKPWCWSHSAGVGIRFSLKSLPAHYNLGFSVGHWHPLNSPSLGVYPGTSSGSSANPQGLCPTLDTPGSPISSWTTLQKKIQPLPQAFEMMTPGWWGREAARIRLPDIIWIWSRTIRHLLSLPVQFHGSCCPNPQMHKREHELFGSFASNIVLWSVWKRSNEKWLRNNWQVPASPFYCFIKMGETVKEKSQPSLEDPLS